MEKTIKPNRSNISVPGHVERMHGKAAASNVDVIMFDLEDSVPVSKKEEARKTVIQTIKKTDFSRKRLTVRINSLDTPFAYQDAVGIVEACGPMLDAVVIPKVDTAGDIHFLDRLLDGIEMAKGFDQRLGIEASIETAKGLENVSSIARASDRLVSLVFGIADYSASVGARVVSLSGHGEKEEEIYPGHRWHYPLSRMVMAAKANGLLAIDATYGNFKDPEGLKKSALMATALGCDGKWVIHPDQVDIVNQVFTPSSEEINRAKTVLDAVGSANTLGRGAVAVEGRMVDQATLRLAKMVWKQALHLGLVE